MLTDAPSQSIPGARPVLARLRRAARFRCPRTPRRARRSLARLLGPRLLRRRTPPALARLRRAARCRRDPALAALGSASRGFPGPRLRRRRTRLRSRGCAALRPAAVTPPWAASATPRAAS